MCPLDPYSQGMSNPNHLRFLDAAAAAGLTKAQTDDLASLIAIAESYPFMAELITEYEAKKQDLLGRL